MLARQTAFLAALLFLAAAARSQCVFYPSDTPAIGAPDDRPFGDTNAQNMRYQIQIPASVLGNQPLDIQEMFIAPAGDHSRAFRRLEVAMGHNPNPITTTMLFNLPGGGAPKVVTKFGDVEFTTTADQWQPIGMWEPYHYDPAKGLLVVSFYVQQAVALPGGTGSTGLRTDASIPFVWNGGGIQFNGIAVPGGGIKLRFCTAHHGVLEFTNGSCVGSNNLEPQLSYSGTPRLGNTVNVHVTDGPAAANTLTVLVWGFQPRPVPFDPTQLGAPGCSLNIQDDAAAWMFSSGGSHTASLAIPAAMPPYLRLWNQWLFFDPTVNQLGITSSTYGGFLIGN